MLGFNKLKEIFAKRNNGPTSASASRAMPAWASAAPLTPLQDYSALLDAGYRRNLVIYCCVNAIASSVAEPALIVKDGNGKELEPKEILPTLLRKPNPEQPKFTFLEGMMINLQATGNAYIQKLRNGMGMPVQLWNLRPDRIRIKLDGKGEIEYYEYRVASGQPLRIKHDDIVHLKLHDPLDDFYGLSPLAVAARVMNLDDQGLDYLRAFFVNGAAPAGLLKFKDPVEPEERDRIKKLWKEMYGTQRGWHDVAVLDAATEWQEIGSRPEKLRMDSLWEVTETRLCAAFRVPPVIAQLTTGMKRATYSNYREALRAFWSQTLVPMYGRIGEALTVGLASDFSGDLSIEFDLSKISVLQEELTERRTFAVNGWSANILKLNEARELAGMPGIGPEGDKFQSETKPPAPAPGPDGKPIESPEADGAKLVPGATKPGDTKGDEGKGKDDGAEGVPGQGAEGVPGQGAPGEAEAVRVREVHHGDHDQKSHGRGGDDGDESSERLVEGLRLSDLPHSIPLSYEPTVLPSNGKAAFTPDVRADSNGDGVTDAARVGVPAGEVPPPPVDLPRMPNLNADERAVEDVWTKRFEANPEAMVKAYQALQAAQASPEKKITFGTDDVKALATVWADPDNRGSYNVVLHQVANAVAKKAFLERLDELKPGDRLLVTNGGCGAGKGYALKNVEETKSLAAQVGAIWDSAGDQNATENTWIMKEAQARGLRPVFAYVHADPYEAWSSDTKGVVFRANSPTDGRMVDADVFADSYTIGAKNFSAFRAKHEKDADFVILENKTTPRVIPSLPAEALTVDRDKLRDYAYKVVAERGKTLRPSVVRGATIGARIWGKVQKGARYDKRTGRSESNASAQPYGELQDAGRVRFGTRGLADEGSQGLDDRAGSQGPRAEGRRQPEVVALPGGVTINILPGGEQAGEESAARKPLAALRALEKRLRRHSAM